MRKCFCCCETEYLNWLLIYTNKLHSLVKWTKKWFVNSNIFKTQLLSFNHLRDTILMSISMADAIHQESNSLRLLGLTFFSSIKLKDCMESTTRSAAKKLGKVCRAGHWPEFVLHIFIQALNIPAKSGLDILVYI